MASLNYYITINLNFAMPNPIINLTVKKTCRGMASLTYYITINLNVAMPNPIINLTVKKYHKYNNIN